MPTLGEPIEDLCVNTMRTLAPDAVQAANSGHPGTPMVMAERDPRRGRVLLVANTGSDERSAATSNRGV